MISLPGETCTGTLFWRRSLAGAAVDASAAQPVISGAEEKLFEFIPAIKFALLIVFVGVIARFLFLLFGTPGFLVGVVVASLTGLDAITIVLAGMAGAALPFSFALLAFLVANAGNLSAKFVYALIWGKREFAYAFLWASAIIVFVSILGYFVV